MTTRIPAASIAVLIVALVFAAISGAAQGQRGRGEPRPVTPMDSTPKTFETADYRIRVVTLVEGLSYPYSFAFLPDGSILLNKLEGRMRMIRDGKLVPEPIGGIPKVHYAPGRGGLMDIALHPNFAQNHLVYFTYDKAGEKGSTQALARGSLQGNQLMGVKDVFVAEAWGPANGHLSARIAFGRDGMLYMAIADHNLLEDVPKTTSHAGKVMRMRDDGDSPSIYATGFRDPHSLVPIPGTDDFWEVEHGDEMNLVKAGGNYGWPFVTTGEGKPIGPPPAGLKLTEPFMKQWPVFHFSGLTIYSGDKFPKWKGNVFIGCLSTQEIHRVVPGKDAPTFREPLFKELGQEVPDVRTGPDGYLYLTTNDPSGRFMRIEPAR
jgi:aldose sugar dehydrogenase